MRTPSILLLTASLVSAGTASCAPQAADTEEKVAHLEKQLEIAMSKIEMLEEVVTRMSAQITLAGMRLNEAEASAADTRKNDDSSATIPREQLLAALKAIGEALHGEGSDAERVRLAKKALSAHFGSETKSQRDPTDPNYDASSYNSRMLASSSNRQIWGVDPDEITWFMEHLNRIADTECKVRPHPGGGLKILEITPGSIWSARGLLAGDVVKNVNGKGIKSLDDVNQLRDNPTVYRRSTLSLMIERAGKPLLIEYRPIPEGRRR